MDKKKILNDLAHIQIMFEKAIRLHGAADIEAYDNEVETMLDVVQEIGGADGVKEFPKITGKIRREIRERRKG